MKRILTLILTAALVLGLCACAGGAPKGLSVGFGRADITPTMKVGLHGYGNVNERQSQGVFNKLYATCIAITGESGETVLLYTVDLISVNGQLTESFRPAVSEATGVPVENITASGTHTHSGPSPSGNSMYWTDIFVPKMVEAAEAAMADRSKVTTVQSGSTFVEGMNFVRHYVTDLGKVVGDNFYNRDSDGIKVGHATEVDNEMQLIRFVRDDKQDVLMANWQGHPKTASTNSTQMGRTLRGMISSDYVGTTRDYLEEKDSDLLFAFYLGASGNVNVSSDLTEEQAKNTMDPKEFGQRLGDYVINALPTLKDQGKPDVKCTRQIVNVPLPSSADGILEMTAVRCGPISFVAAPFEMFDTQGMFIKDESPSETTFVMTCACGHSGYIPSDYAWDYFNCYEVRSSRFGRGAAEIFAQAAVDALTAMN